MAIPHEFFIDSHKLVALSFNPHQTGTPIILLHGICSSIYYWQNPDLLSVFLPYGPCYALSLPGHFPALVSAQFQQEAIQPYTMAKLLDTAIRELVGDQAVILVGHSTGGFAALNVAAHYPDLARYIISIAGFAQGQWTGVLGTSQAFARSGNMGKLLFKLGMKLNVNSRTMHRVSLRLLSANVQGLFSNPNLDTSIDTYLPYARLLDLTTINKYFAEMPNIDIRHLLSRINAPTLALTGDQDPIVPPAQSRLIAQRVPYGNLALLKGAGHLPFFENPSEYQQILGGWLDQQVH